VVTGNLRPTNYTTCFYCAVINSLLVKYGLNKAEMNCELNRRITQRILRVFNERELTITFAICYRRSVCLSSVTFVHPTQPVEIFGNFFPPFGTVAIR